MKSVCSLRCFRRAHRPANEKLKDAVRAWTETSSWAAIPSDERNPEVVRIPATVHQAAASVVPPQRQAQGSGGRGN